jgi:hypothetical protein
LIILIGIDKVDQPSQLLLAVQPRHKEYPMPLFLAEIRTTASVESTLDQIREIAADIGADFVEAQVTADRSQVFAIIEAADETASDPLHSALTAADLSVEAVSTVRLVGADLAEIKAHRPTSGYLVEWDLPDGLTMDAYLTRKKEKSPLYAQVPETTFQRTYVREDMVKCLCFYDAPDAEAVLRARDVVNAPVDRLHELSDVPIITP